jgi:hypothetical protein
MRDTRCRSGSPAALAAACLLLGACSFDRGEHEAACATSDDCRAGARCVRGFCLTSSGQSQADGGTDAGQAGEPCAEGQPPERCYEGPQGTKDVGVCRGGERACVSGTYTRCLGQVLPSEETCNERDDDCDGTIDEIEVSEPCETSMRGVCAMGLLVCRGAFAVCESQVLAQDEVCNGLDDDCDGKVDEIGTSACFPSGATGCTEVAPSVFECVGVCRAGRLSCDGEEGQCEDAVVPGEEECTSGGGTARDEDCDGSIDEACPCTTGATRSCYGGPAGTEGRGPCRAGTQSCVNDLWGACQGQVLPGTETCQNMGVDDDCDGTLDNLPNATLGESCTNPDNVGLCRQGTWQCTDAQPQPVCVTASPVPEICDGQDQDCDGRTDEGLLGTDQHCQRCGDACGSGAACCDGTCRSAEEFRHDDQNCGGCGRACGEDTYCCWNDCIPRGGTTGLPADRDACGCEQDCRSLMCCGKECVDLQNDPYNCGFCGNDCTRMLLRSCCTRGQCTQLCAAEL